MSEVLKAAEKVIPTKYGHRSKPEDWTCPHCDAEPRTPCKTPKGRKVPAHKPRIYKTVSYQILTCLWS